MPDSADSYIFDSEDIQLIKTEYIEDEYRVFLHLPRLSLCVARTSSELEARKEAQKWLRLKYASMANNLLQVEGYIENSTTNSKV
jgi:hypothetical protein